MTAPESYDSKQALAPSPGTASLMHWKDIQQFSRILSNILPSYFDSACSVLSHRPVPFPCVDRRSCSSHDCDVKCMPTDCQHLVSVSTSVVRQRDRRFCMVTEGPWASRLASREGAYHGRRSQFLSRHDNP